MTARILGAAAIAAALTGCGSVEIESLAGCYQIDDAPAFRLGNGYGVFVDDRPIARMRMSETDQGARYDVRPGLIAVAGETGYIVQPDRGTAERAGFIQRTLFGSVYMAIPTGDAETPEVEAYLVEGAEC